MLYQKTTFTLPVSTRSMSELEYSLRVGKISEEEYSRIAVELSNGQQLPENYNSAAPPTRKSSEEKGFAKTRSSSRH